MTDSFARITEGVKGLGSNLSNNLTRGLYAVNGSVTKNLNTVKTEFANLGDEAKKILPGQNAPTPPVEPVAPTAPVAPAGIGGRRRRTRKSKKSSKKGKKRSSRKGKKRSTKKRVRFSRRR